MKKKSFILYCDYLEHIQKLEDDEAGKLFKAILRYAAEGTTTELPGAAGMAFSFIKSQMERDDADYVAKCEKLRKNGAKGGRPKQKVIEEPNGYIENQMVIEEPNAPLNDTDTVNDNDTVNDTDNDTDIIIYVCELLNQAKRESGNKGLLKANTSVANNIFDDLHKKCINNKMIVEYARELADVGKNVDWYEFRDDLIKKQGGRK